MVKIPEAQNRLFHNVFVCKKCKSKMRTQNIRVLKKEIKCRKCGSKALRAKKTRRV